MHSWAGVELRRKEGELKVKCGAPLHLLLESLQASYRARTQARMQVCSKLAACMMQHAWEAVMREAVLTWNSGNAVSLERRSVTFCQRNGYAGKRQPYRVKHTLHDMHRTGHGATPGAQTGAVVD